MFIVLPIGTLLTRWHRLTLQVPLYTPRGAIFCVPEIELWPLAYLTGAISTKPCNGSDLNLEDVGGDIVEDSDDEEADLVVELRVVENLLEDDVHLVDGQRQRRLLLAAIESSLSFGQGPLVHRCRESSRNPFLESNEKLFSY